MTWQFHTSRQPMERKHLFLWSLCVVAGITVVWLVYLLVSYPFGGVKLTTRLGLIMCDTLPFTSHIIDAQKLFNQRLQEQLRYGNLDVRLATVDYLGKSGDQFAVDMLFEYLKDSNDQVRAAVASSVGAPGNTRAFEVLLSMMFLDNSSDVRSGAAWSLGRIRDRRAVVPIIVAAQQGKISDYSAVGALWSLRDERAVDLLTKIALSSEGKETRRDAILGLGSIGGEKAFEALIEMLSSPDVRTRTFAARGLREIRDGRAVEPLIAMVEKEQDLEACAAAASALGKLGDTRAIGYLVAAKQRFSTCENYEKLARTVSHSVMRIEQVAKCGHKGK